MGEEVAVVLLITGSVSIILGGDFSSGEHESDIYIDHAKCQDDPDHYRGKTITRVSEWENCITWLVWLILPSAGAIVISRWFSYHVLVYHILKLWWKFLITTVDSPLHKLPSPKHNNTKNFDQQQIWACQDKIKRQPHAHPQPQLVPLMLTRNSQWQIIRISSGSEATAAQKRFPRFLVIEGLDPNKTLRRANGTILDKTIDGATSVTTKREWMGKAVLVEVNCGAYSNNLLKLTQIGDMPVRVSAHRSLNYAKGMVRFRQAAQDLTNEDLARDLNMSRHNREQPQVKDASRVTITKGGKKVQTGTFFLTFDAPTLPEHIFLGFEKFDFEKYIPLPRRCFKCQQFGHGARTCRTTEDICPLCSGTHKQDDCPNKESPKCPNCDVHILPPAGNAQHSSLRKEPSRSKWRVAAHFLQPGSKQGRPQSGPQRWERQIAGSDHYTSPG